MTKDECREALRELTKNLIATACDEACNQGNVLSDLITDFEEKNVCLVDDLDFKNNQLSFCVDGQWYLIQVTLTPLTPTLEDV